LKQLPSFFGSPGDDDNLWQEAYEFNFKGTALEYRAILNLGDGVFSAALPGGQRKPKLCLNRQL